MRHLQQRLGALDVADCNLCGTPLVEGSGSNKRMCACCGMIMCLRCCNRPVFELSLEKIIYVCGHCYDKSSRITRPGFLEEGRGNHTPTKGLGQDEVVVKWARCNHCGERVPRDVDAIEDHGIICVGQR